MFLTHNEKRIFHLSKNIALMRLNENVAAYTNTYSNNIPKVLLNECKKKIGNRYIFTYRHCHCGYRPL